MALSREKDKVSASGHKTTPEESAENLSANLSFTTYLWGFIREKRAFINRKIY